MSRNTLTLQVMQRQIEDIEKHDQDAMNEFGLPLQTGADFEQINVLLGDKAKIKYTVSSIIY